MIFFTEIENLPVFDARGEYLGRLMDVTVDPSQDALRVASYLVRTPSKQMLCITHEQMQSVSVRAAQTTVRADDIRCYAPDEGLLRLKKEVLDQQIIDVNDRKVVRANDVDLDIRPSNGHTELRILAVNVGMAAAVRRLLQGLTSKHNLRRIAGLFPSKIIPWGFVNLIESDPKRRVKLRISYDRLAKLHPADIADILEKLSRDEQTAVIESLDEETAAQVMSEMSTRNQAAILESMPAEKAADIVEEMPPDEAADVLQEMTPETSAGVLAGMEKEDAQEVQELLAFEEGTAGSLMTTEYVVVGETATAEGAMGALRHFEGPLEAIHMIYLIGQGAVLTGAVPIARILLAEMETPLKDLSADPLISVSAQADKEEVVSLFHKYNLVALPVVNDQRQLIGVVTADDVLELVLARN
jgi:magnesium transporter